MLSCYKVSYRQSINKPMQLEENMWNLWNFLNYPSSWTVETWSSALRSILFLFGGCHAPIQHCACLPREDTCRLLCSVWEHSILFKVLSPYYQNLPCLFWIFPHVLFFPFILYFENIKSLLKCSMCLTHCVTRLHTVSRKGLSRVQWKYYLIIALVIIHNENIGR